MGIHGQTAGALICMVITAHSFAQQSPTGRINGHVVDIVGATVSGASVYVRRNIPPEQDIKLLTHTDTQGDFKLVLAEGGYDVLVTAPGFAASVQTTSVMAGKTRKFQWRLKSLNCNFPGMNCDVF